jgi:hypothetical protein
LGTMNLLRCHSSFVGEYFVGRLVALACLATVSFCPSRAQAQTVEILPTTPLSVELPRHSPMRAGEQIDGRLLYPVYVGNELALPSGTTLHGRVVRLDPDRSRRIHSSVRGDFTPFHVPVLQFDQVSLPNGAVEPISCTYGKDGVVILRLSPPPGQKKVSLIRRQMSDLKHRVKDAAALFTTPGRGDRLVQFIYTQLPYHPQRIEAGTTWTVELIQPLRLKVEDRSPLTLRESIASEHEAMISASRSDPVISPASQSGEWQLRAYLQQMISSAQAKPGDTFQAYVAEPVLNLDHAIVVPQGSMLTGEITQAKAARSFGRQGKLRFHFKELKLPSGFTQPVEGVLTGVDTNKSANLQADSEGGIQPQSQNRVVVPLILSLLATRAFDDDENRVLNNGVASNGFGILGRVAGLAARSGNVAAGIGIYGAALSFYDLWLARGHDVVFAKDTRVEITIAPSRNPMNPAGNEQTPPPVR